MRSHKSIKVPKLYWGHMCGVRVVIYKGHVIESRKFKNRDKQMTYIVRVSTSSRLKLSRYEGTVMVVFNPEIGDEIHLLTKFIIRVKLLLDFL